MILEEQIAEAMIRATTAPAEAGDDAVRHAREDDGHLWHIARVQARAAITLIHAGLATRFNSHLIEMKPDYDDSITGFNEAWNVATKYLT
jgi:hypothetical protein